MTPAGTLRSPLSHRSPPRRRRWANVIFCSLLALAAAAALIPLLGVFGYVVAKGAPALGWAFFTEIPKPVGEVGGGMANAIAGSILLVVLASAIGVPWGLAVGLYLSEMGQGSRLGKLVRFAAEQLASIPSIVIGLFVYALVVMPMHRFSAWAGGLALGLIMIPTVARGTEEILMMVPAHVREAGLALGLPRWRVTLWIVLRGVRKGVVTCVMLAAARAAGETAPLLFTAFGNRFWSSTLDQPIASLPVQIYSYAISPYDDWRAQAWAGAFVLILTIFTLNLLTRVWVRGKVKEMPV